jgi:dTDP-4-dehydrorhamnose reductase
VLSALPGRTNVVRTAWVYGGPGPNFVDTMLRLEQERDTVDVVADQTGSPTYVRDLAAALVELGRASVAPGVLHYANAGSASWFELARETFRLAGADPERVRPTDTASFPRPAPRPAWSVLSTRAWQEAGLSAPRPWREALAEKVAATRR